MAETNEVTYRISILSGSIVVGLAIIADLIQVFFSLTGIFVFLSDFVTFFVGGIITLWFIILGISFTGGKKALLKTTTLITEAVVEIIPFLNALPTLTIGTIVIIKSSRSEDRDKFKILNKK